MWQGYLLQRLFTKASVAYERLERVEDSSSVDINRAALIWDSFQNGVTIKMK